MTVVSILFGMTSAAAGLLISYYADLPSGPAIILLQAAVFFAILGVQRMRHA
jgi:ABC-type Mn2+/Zn2+ transport system permease subunit